MADANSTVTLETPEREVLSQNDARRIASKLMDVGYIFLSMHNLTRLDPSSIGDDDLAIIVGAMSKQGLRSIDACISKLGHEALSIGNFSEEFESEAEEELSHE